MTTKRIGDIETVTFEDGDTVVVRKHYNARTFSEIRLTHFSEIGDLQYALDCVSTLLRERRAVRRGAEHE